MLFMIMKSDIDKLVCILFVHLSSISLENFKDRSLINPEILELIKLHTYKFGLVYIIHQLNRGHDLKTAIHKELKGTREDLSQNNRDIDVWSEL